VGARAWRARARASLLTIVNACGFVLFIMLHVLTTLRGTARLRNLRGYRISVVVRSSKAIITLIVGAPLKRVVVVVVTGALI
jgi:hypothetical protein